MRSSHALESAPGAPPFRQKGVAGYLIFLAGNTGLVPQERCAAARSLLERYATIDALVDGISR